MTQVRITRIHCPCCNAKTFAAMSGMRCHWCERILGERHGDFHALQPAITTQAVGVLGVQLTGVGDRLTATTLAAAGKFTGKISWDPSGAVPEGGLR